MASNVILWTRGQDLLVLSVAFGSASSPLFAGSATVNFNPSGYMQNKGTGPAGVSPAGGGPTVTLSQTPIRGNCDGLRIANHYMLDQILALDANTDNFVEILQSADVSLGEVMKQSGNILPYGYHRGIATGEVPTPYVQITAAIGNASHYRGYILTMQRSTLTDGVTNFGKNTIEMTLKPADLGYPSVQYFESS